MGEGLGKTKTWDISIICCTSSDADCIDNRYPIFNIARNELVGNKCIADALPQQRILLTSPAEMSRERRPTSNRKSTKRIDRVA